MGIIEFLKRKVKRKNDVSNESNENKKRSTKKNRDKNYKILKSKFQYIKAFPLLGLADIPSIQTELKNGNIIILNISHFLKKSEPKLRELKRAVDQLSYITKIHEGEIAQLGEKHIIMTPSSGIRIWKEKLQENF
ncbi:MAG: cell division protein SepF [Candidatus Helarchaeota archaeon]